MAIFPFFKKKNLLSALQEEEIVKAIRDAEKNTSGEVRVFIESKCRFVNPVDRAIEVFYGLKMEQTDEHNGVLVYVALKDRQLAIYGDDEINKRVGEAYWKNAVQQMLAHFNAANYVEGICAIVTTVGQTLAKEFPYKPKDDKNELPDEIVFGK